MFIEMKIIKKLRIEETERNIEQCNKWLLKNSLKKIFSETYELNS